MALLALNHTPVEAETFYASRLVIVFALPRPVPRQIISALTEASNLRLCRKPFGEDRSKAIPPLLTDGVRT